MAADAASPAVATVSGAATEAQPTAAQRLGRSRPGERNACETPYGRKIKAVEKTYQEDTMPTFILSLNWTEQGIRSVKDAPKRAEASKELAKKVGVEIKQVYLTTGEDDLLVIVDAPNGDNVTKFALALGAQGNVRTRTSRAWPQSEFQKLISELP